MRIRLGPPKGPLEKIGAFAGGKVDEKNCESFGLGLNKIKNTSNDQHDKTKMGELPKISEFRRENDIHNSVLQNQCDQGP